MKNFTRRGFMMFAGKVLALGAVAAASPSTALAAIKPKAQHGVVKPKWTFKSGATLEFSDFHESPFLGDTKNNMVWDGAEWMETKVEPHMTATDILDRREEWARAAGEAYGARVNSDINASFLREYAKDCEKTLMQKRTFLKPKLLGRKV